MDLSEKKELVSVDDDADSGIYLSGATSMMSDQNILQNTKEVEEKASHQRASFGQLSVSGIGREPTQRYMNCDIQTDASPIDIRYGENKTDLPTRLVLDEALSRPKDQFNQSMRSDDLINIAIVFSKEDLKLAEHLKRWLVQMTERHGLGKIIIELSNSETFPPNQVNAVDDLMNRSMRVLMLLSSNFQKHSDLNFLREECVAKARLQDMSPCKNAALFSTKVLKRKQQCIRPVHSTDTHMYETPAGLAALRALHFTETKRETDYEQNEFLKVIQGSIKDLGEHAEILNSSLPIRSSDDVSDCVVTDKNVHIDTKLQQRSSSRMGLQTKLKSYNSKSDKLEIDAEESDDDDIETDAQNFSSSSNKQKRDSNYPCKNGVGGGGGTLVITGCKNVSVSTGGQSYVSRNQLEIEENKSNGRQTNRQYCYETAV